MAKKRVSRRRYFRRPRFHRKNPKTISILSLAGIAGGVMGSFNNQPSLYSAFEGVRNGSLAWSDFGNDLLGQTLGYNPQTKQWMLPSLTTGAILGYVLHRAVGVTGVNRKMPKVMGYKIEL